MEGFLRFHSVYKESADPIRLEPRMRLPEKLASFLEGRNETIFDKGFLSLTDPKKYMDILGLWNLNPEDCFPYLKTAFGAFIFYHHNEYKLLDPVYNKILILGEADEFEFVMDIILCDQKGLDSTLFMNLYMEVVDKIGVPEMDECYTFVPAVNLGGIIMKNNIRKAKLKEQMLILSQL
jgi:hypothetical protein